MDIKTILRNSGLSEKDFLRQTSTRRVDLERMKAGRWKVRQEDVIAWAGALGTRPEKLLAEPMDIESNVPLKHE